MNLISFIRDKMRMSHIYQPVMIKTLVLNRGVASRAHIAKAILEYDISQLEYYEAIVDRMVGRILRRHQVVKKDLKNYVLIDYAKLSEEDKLKIVELCEEKIRGYFEARGSAMFEHRRKNRAPVKGSIRYEVLKRARGRCELCGVGIDERALEVDHIVPKNHGGEDSIHNYQALCYKCNSNKGDKDDTDFRNLETEYKERSTDCIFCLLKRKEIVFENNLALLIEDKFPVTEGHALVIPKRHCRDYFELHQAEINAINELIFTYRQDLLRQDKSIEGFNIGVNNGEVAGQTIFHCHIHIIPRRHGDVKVARGGVRHVIPNRGNY